MKITIPAFFNRLPSLATEEVGALVAVVLALALTAILGATVGAVLMVATALSLIYERFLDANGFSWADVGQRSAGIAAFVALWGLIR